MTNIAGSGSDLDPFVRGHRSADPDEDPHQNVMDPEHWFAKPPFSIHCDKSRQWNRRSSREDLL
jgi:hypothetical protein